MLVPILISLILLAIFTLIIARNSFFQIKGIPGWLVVSSFYIKLLGGLMIWYVYTYYYTDRSAADIYKYFDDAQAIRESSSGDHAFQWQLFLPFDDRSEGLDKVLQDTQHWDKSSVFLVNDNRSIIRIHYLLLFISKGFFHLHTLIFCMLSFIGSIALLRFFKLFTEIPALPLFLFFFLIPSGLFFASGASKESWLLFNMGCFLYSLAKLLLKKEIHSLLITLLFAYLFIQIKPYVFLCLMPGILLLILARIRVVKSLLVFALILLATIGLSFYFNQGIIHVLQQKQMAFIELAIKSNASSYFNISKFSSLNELVMQLPEAIINVWIRPFLLSPKNTLAIASFIESIVLIILLLLPFRYYKLTVKKEFTIALFCLSFVFLMSIIIGLTTPVMGAIIRYKVPILPFYSVLILSFIDFNKMPLKLRSFNK